MSTIRKSKKGVLINILILNFQDESGVHYVYAPQLDLTGYGESPEEALASFDIVLKDFFDYGIKKKTLDAELRRLGWRKAKTTEYKVPTASELPDERFSNFFDEYPNVQSQKRPYNIPAFA